jgi:hypothetical protein
MDAVLPLVHKGGAVVLIVAIVAIIAVWIFARKRTQQRT